MNKVLIFSGSAGSGKGTVLAIARKKDPRLCLSVSMTTRAPREGEVDGREYYFTTRENFERAIAADEFLEYQEYCGNFYGTPKKQFFDILNRGQIPVLEIETKGAYAVMDKLDDYHSVFLSPPDYETLEKRLRGRATETEESIRNRLKTAREEILRSVRYQHVILNRQDRAEEAADALLDIVNTGESRSDAEVRDREAFLASFQNK